MHHIDSHKLHLHPCEVARWLEGQTVAPIYVEISPAGGCNHRCRFCGMRFLGYKPRFLPTEALCSALRSMGQAGVKSVMFAGEGEPLLHADIVRLATEAHGNGMDVAFTTNGVLLKPELAEALLPVSSWIKISCNGGTVRGYSAIHAAPEQDFHQLVAYVEQAVRLREKQGSACTIGMQMLILQDSLEEILPFCRLAASLGVDYAVLKPYSEHIQSPHPDLHNVPEDQCLKLEEQWKKLERPDFSIIFRRETLARLHEDTSPYTRCLALPFGGFVDAGGTLWGCLRHIGDERFAYGNILEQDFAVLLNDARPGKMHHCEQEMDIGHCHVGCRWDAINRYLHALRSPHPHANFI